MKVSGLLIAPVLAASSGLLGAAPTAPLAPAVPDVRGEWWTPGFNARVRIETCGNNTICGRIVWLWDEQPQRIADTTPLIGKLVIDRMTASGAGTWSGGRLYNPEDGNHYKGSLSMRTDSTLLVNGCLLFLCQSQVWRRADAGRCPPVAGGVPPD